MGNDGEVKIGTSLDSSGVEGGMSKLGKVVGKAGGIAVAGVTAVATGVTATATAMIDATNKTAQYGDSIDKMSQKLGISAEAYQEWDFVAQHSGTTMDSLRSSFRTVATSIQNTTSSQQEAFDALGLSVEELRGMSTEDAFSKIISSLQSMEQGTERTYYATKLLGKGSGELGALLNTSAEDTQAMIQQVHELGGVMSDDAVKASARYEDALQNLQTSFTGLRNNLAGDVLTPMVDIMEGLSQIVAGNEEGFDRLQVGVQKFGEVLSGLIPRIAEIGGGILKSLARAMMDNMPIMIQSFVDLFNDLIQAVVEYIPMFSEISMQIFSMLIDTLLQFMPELLTALIDATVNITEELINYIPVLTPLLMEVVAEIAQILSGNLEPLLTLALTMIEVLAQSLVANAPILIQAVPKILGGLTGQMTLFVAKGVNSIVATVISMITDLMYDILVLLEALFDSVVAILGEFIMALTDHLDEIWSIWSDLWADIGPIVMANVGPVIEWCKNAFNKIINTLKTAGGNAKIFLSNLFKSMISEAKINVAGFVNIGKMIIDGLLNGLKSSKDGLLRWMQDMCDSLIQKAKSAFNIHSPSRVFANIGEMNARGLIVGWDKFDPMRKLKSQLDSGVDNLSRTMSGAQFGAYNNGINYDAIGDAVADGIVSANITVGIDGRSYGRLVRSMT